VVYAEELKTRLEKSGEGITSVYEIQIVQCRGAELDIELRMGGMKDNELKSFLGCSEREVGEKGVR
jgi:hypothetical protein